jgi:hypothetical protein
VVGRGSRPRGRSSPPGKQKLIRVTEAVIANSPAFRFAKSFTGLEGRAARRRRDRVGRGSGGARALRQLRPGDAGPEQREDGLTAVRLGRIEAFA